MDISPDKQNICCLSIDFYQRDYKWTAVAAQRLLDDIYYPFGGQYQKYADVDPSKESVMVVAVKIVGSYGN